MLAIEYQSLVLEEYRRKEAAGDLSHRMRDRTPAKLKEECMAVCRERYDRKDEKTLHAFFIKYEGCDKEVCLRAISGHDIDQFRPLVNFLKGSIRNPDPKTVELLAWLIDFKPRPLEEAKKSGINGPDIPDGVPDKPPAPIVSAKPAPVVKPRKILVAAIIALLIAIGLYRVFPNKVYVPTGPQGCMYWVEDRYQPISCSQHPDNALVIGLDSATLINFRKIMKPDTITEASIGRLWYIKYRGNTEFYTSEGFHPIDPSLRTLRLSERIYRVHVLPLKH